MEKPGEESRTEVGGGEIRTILYVGLKGHKEHG
jgi:hypothetical protein